LSGIVTEIYERGSAFGSVLSSEENGVHRSTLLEYISANPTGPLHIGNARGGFFGDALARILKKAGYSVSTEYYVNDAGEQVMKLGHSVLKDEEAVYGGEYIDDLCRQISKYKLQVTNVREVGIWAAGVVLEEYIKKTISEKMNISFDRFVSEREDIVEAGYVDRAIAFFKEKGLTFEGENALWLRTTEFGDDKDRVLVKANSEKTYFASDCGYILYKKERGFERLIEVWGADHHGYVARFRAAAEALGFEKNEVSFVLVQLVRLVKDGQEVRMSKRAGNIVLVDDLIDRVGVDVARFFFLLYSPDTHMNFDLGLAEERSQKNPVYYVQYAHARMASIFKKAEEELGMINDEFGFQNENFVFGHVKEKLLIRHLAKFPEVIETSAETLAVHQLPQYAICLADLFHSFYAECVVINAEDPKTTRARLTLVRAGKTVLAETLRLLGISAPERM
jgi:arginyl-tRNA synthetase